MGQDSASFVVRDGRASKEIVEQAEKGKIDLIIMAVKGQSNLEHVLIGSNAERVVCTAPCPVLTVGRSLTSSP
jgi:nucleotide-binding universal stress UspA family protein